MALDGLRKREHETREIGRKVALRVGRLLGTSVDKQRQLKKAISGSYDVRGDVVDGRPDYSDNEVEEAVATAEEVLRSSLTALAAKQQRIDLTTET